MSQGRGSAYASVIAMLMILNFMAQLGIAEAKTGIYTVGDDKGWTFNVASWPDGKRFVVGDVLVFKYNPQYHNVVEVSKEDYKSCKISAGSKTLNSGYDKITLVQGKQYFVCGIPGHCFVGMKIAVDVV